MDFEILGLIFLKSFNKLKSKCNEIDKKVETQCFSSNDINKIFDKVIKLNNSKRALCNVKVVIIETLKKLKNRQFLIDRYIIRLSIQELSEKYSIKSVSIPKKIKREVNKFCNVMIESFSKEFLIQIYETSDYIKNMYNDFINNKKGVYK